MHLHKKMMIFSKKRMMKTKTIRYKINEETKNGVRKEKMIMFDLTGNVAVVTGASAGLGRQFALALARQGADVAILARRKEKLEGVAEEIIIPILAKKFLTEKIDLCIGSKMSSGTV